MWRLLTVVLLLISCERKSVDLGPGSVDNTRARVEAGAPNSSEPEALAEPEEDLDGDDDPEPEPEPLTEPEPERQSQPDDEPHEPDDWVAPGGICDESLCSADDDRFCDRNECVECVSSLDCAQRFGPDKGVCFFGNCRSCDNVDQCRLWGGSCERGTCEAQRCSSELDCFGYRRCVVPEGEDDDEGYCVYECWGNHDCRQGTHCVNSICVPALCSADFHCEFGWICVEGYCQLPPPPSGMPPPADDMQLADPGNMSLPEEMTPSMTVEEPAADAAVPMDAGAPHIHCETTAECTLPAYCIEGHCQLPEEP